MFLIPDPNGPIERFPHRPGGPLRFREVTPRELHIWQCMSQAVCSGHAWTEEMEQAAGEQFDAQAHTTIERAA